MKDLNQNIVTILMVGIGGYGYYYLQNLFENYSHNEIVITGVVDPLAENSGLFTELGKRGIQVYNTVEDFYHKGGEADLVIISSPIHYHIDQSCVALKNGSNVLCDKPLSPVIQHIERLIKERDKSGKWIMIGYQWSYSKAIQELKNDIISGLFGKPIRMKSLCYWPREESYYKRNNWAGKIKDDDGKWILDSPLGNAMAHFIHNMFYLLGSQTDKSDHPVELVGECYKAYPIQNYDTGMFRAITAQDVEILFFGSHTTEHERGPIFQFEFENGTIKYGNNQKNIIAEDHTEKIIKTYGSPEDDDQFLKLHEAIKTVKEGGPMICGPEAATAQVLCVNGIQDSVEEIMSFSTDRIKADENNERLWVEDLGKDLYTCYLNNVLASEANLSWAIPGKKIDLRNYTRFPGGKE